MLVHQILKTKADDAVISVLPGTSLGQCAQILSMRRIGALIVSRDGRQPLGILSERDIVRELGRRGAGCLSDAVEQVMTTRLVACQRSDSASEVMTRMTEGRFRHMPVLEQGEMVGLISIGDVVKARLAEMHAESEALVGMIAGH